MGPTSMPAEPFWLFIGYRVEWELLSAPESLEVLTFWEVSDLQLPLPYLVLLGPEACIWAIG